ncbi:MAG: EscU/YscU/HrcU family type III secretion system export apparatus switch protein [Oscillospiraceae bacterium]|jgi:FlhB-like protein|nr:EscU/YscU/HrcU family type III secretion system export apparatus switch protein [Oscillospiraceae bacterium]
MSRYKKKRKIAGGNKAVALRYNNESDNAPIVIASGYGTIADKIIDIAEQNGIPVFRDDSAASLLCMLDVGESIPPELYEVVAAIYVQLLKTAAQIKGTAGINEKIKLLSRRKSAETVENTEDITMEDLEF